jgi:GNAT superfamily N-acetyltransferase
MQGLAETVTMLRPEILVGGATVGELAWNFGKDRVPIGDTWRHRVWRRADGSGELDAWAWVYLPYTVTRSDGSMATSTSANLIWQVHPDRPGLVDEILDWYAQQAAGLDRFITPQDGDTDMLSRLPAHGYQPDREMGGNDGDWHQFNRRPLRDLPDPALPAGFRFRTAAEVGPLAATRAHVDAWHPSTFTETSMAGVQATWPYRDDLHVLIEAPDGTLVATAVMWFDPASRTAEFEPVGTHQAYRRRGLATALLWYGMHRARDAGAETMLVACLGAPARSAARDLYYGVGFQPFSRDVPHVKRAQ